MSNMIEYPVGSIYITSTHTNPVILGVSGVWELIEKKFKTIMNGDATNFTANSSVCTLGGCRIFRDDQHVYVKLVVNTVVDISETDQTLGTINLAAVGLDQWVNMYMVGESDNGNAMICGYTYNTNGTVRTYDIISRTSGASLPSGSTIRINIEWVPHTDAMLDSACNRFYWQKISDSLVNTTWKFDDEIESFPTTRYFYMNFFYNNSTAYMCTCMEWVSGACYYTPASTSSRTLVYDAAGGAGWSAANYQTITFNSEPTDSAVKTEFLAWLPDHATYQS